jgi:CheY-like chemotaxis protein
MPVAANMIRVLIVNDQEDIARLWQRLVNTTTGMQCVGYARDGEEAIQMARQLMPQVIMMDIMMPGIDGLEATRVIKDLMPETLIIAYSAYIGMNEKAYEAGADEFILMPVAPNKLLETIRRVHSQARDALS